MKIESRSVTKKRFDNERNFGPLFVSLSHLVPHLYTKVFDLNIKLDQLKVPQNCFKTQLKNELGFQHKISFIESNNS